LASTLTQIAPSQTAGGAKKSKGPRALGLLEFGPKGKPRLIPITILYDGQYYDAGAYKASPVPIALWSGTVYEGFRAGISQGLFTVTGALENPETKEWLAEGTWLPAGSIPAKSSKKAASSEPRGLNDDSGPPVLRRAPAEQPKAPETPPTPPVPEVTPQPQAAASTPPATASATVPPPATSSAAVSPPSAADTPAPEDPNRPTLKRGKPAPKPVEPLPTATANPSPPVAQPNAQPQAPSAPVKTTPLQLIPAISDATGPEPQSYKYDMKLEDENQLRNKALALAADEVRTRAKQLAAATAPSTEPAAKPGQRGKSAASHPSQPGFTDVQFRAFDLSNSNEPLLILTTAAQLPQNPKEKTEPASQVEFLVTLVAREDSNGDFHKIFSNVTDAAHFDVSPRLEFIDAVDADGDGRGELLFRQISDAGNAFVVYRVVGNRLYALFQGTPGR
jgi:hypothetical protein